MEVFTSRSRDHFPISSAGSRSSHRDRFLPTHLPRFRARCARSSLSSLLALERSFLPARHHRFQFRIVVRCLRLLRLPLLSTSRVGSWHCHTVASGALHRGRVFSLPPPFFIPFSPSCNLHDHSLRQLASSSPRHLLKCCFALLQGHFGRLHDKLCSSMGPLKGGSILLNAY